MIGKIKIWGLAILSFLVAVFYALFQRESALRAKEKLDGEIQARKTSDTTNKAMMDGLNNEQEALHEASKPVIKRDGFE